MESCMSTEEFDTSAKNVEPAARESAFKTHPAPSMLWMLLPIALLAVMAFLSR